MNTLGDEYPKEQARLRHCLKIGYEMGPSCAFYCTTIEDILARADKAAMEQNMSAMIRLYQEMKEISE